MSAGNLWYRQGLAPSYPQGSSWELISNNVAKVSVGPLDQVKGGDPGVAHSVMLPWKQLGRAWE